jgi:hypothetical protein
MGKERNEMATADRTHVSRQDLSAETMGDYEGRIAELGEYTVSFESLPKGFPPGGTDAFKGLPDDACQSPHWGYLFKGSFRLRYTDGSETFVQAGEAYYAPPGHQFEALEDCETVEFSPTKELQETLEVVGPNVERFLAGAG